MKMNQFLAAYDIDDLITLENPTDTKENYDISASVCEEKVLVALHNHSKLHFPSYMLRFGSFEDIEMQGEGVLSVVMESGSEGAFNELNRRYEGKLSKATDEFLAIAAQKRQDLTLDILTEVYEPIVNKIINRVERRYFFRGLEKDDLLQEAFIGFLKAVEVFKVERRTKFKDFSRHVIERHLGTLMNRSTNLRNRALNESFSYNMPVNTNNETTFEDLLEGVPINPENILMNKVMYEEIKSKLTESEEAVLIPYSKGYSYEEIAFIIIQDKGEIDLGHYTYKTLMEEIKKNEAYLSTKQTTYQKIAEKLTEKNSVWAEGKTSEQLIDDIERNLAYENIDGLTYKMLAEEIKKRRKSVDNTIQRFRSKGFEHRMSSLRVNSDEVFAIQERK